MIELTMAHPDPLLFFNERIFVKSEVTLELMHRQVHITTKQYARLC
jgi:hypothetical protein